MRDIIIKKYQFAHPIQKVWEAISVGEEISSWFIEANFEAVVGFKYTFTHENTRIIGEVLAVNPVYWLKYTWEVEGTHVITTVSWKLEENVEGTLLTLEHTGMSKYTGETAVMMFNNFEEGWETCIDHLEKYLK
ncbi:SRPBCC family protein [Flexithrix dorotheae]|uniref:SRPBCC family protein n=1 Tax=Flexithrix dorotheae TaxID=70993 RepID=UPI00037804B8|nr:SRPBCC domain-containing protein [Flexithrix dorotheae]